MSNVNATKAPISLERGYRPSDDEPFMNDRQREYFRRKLRDWKEEIIRDSELTLTAMQSDTDSIRIWWTGHRRKATEPSSCGPGTASAS